MDLIRLTDNVYHLRAGFNAGLLVQGDRASLVDAGLDRDAARRILKHVATRGVELAVVLKHVADAMAVSVRQPAICYLMCTTIHACLHSLRRASLAGLKLRDNRITQQAGAPVSRELPRLREIENFCS